MNRRDDARHDDGDTRALTGLLSTLEAALRRLRTLITSAGAGGSAPTDRGRAPAGLPDAALQALAILRAAERIAAPSRVAFVGPVAPGTRMREDVPVGREGKDFLIPRLGNNHYVFFIDDEPDRRFDHGTRFAWVEVDSGQSRVIPLRERFTLLPPDREPQPLREVATWRDGDVVVTFAEGDFAGQLRDTTGKPADAPADPDNVLEASFDPNDPSLDDLWQVPPPDDVLPEEPPRQQPPPPVQTPPPVEKPQPPVETPPPVEKPPVPPATCVKRALVCDFGDKDGILFDLADNMAEDADAIATWLGGEGFGIVRRSQYWGNTSRGFQGRTRASFLARLRAEGRLLAMRTAALAGTTCCHEFFLYVAAHGNANGVVIFDFDGRGRREFVRFDDILATIRDSFPDNVVVTIFVDACGSGGLITELRSNFAALCRKFSACGLTVLTATSGAQSAPGGQGVDSATEDFFDGADEDHDLDGRVGDIRDRFNEMRLQRLGYDPQFFHCGPPSWGSLD